MKFNSEGLQACTDTGNRHQFCSMGNSAAAGRPLFTNPRTILEEAAREPASRQPARLHKGPGPRQPEPARADLARLQENLRESEERYQLLAGHANDCAVFKLDSQGNVVSWNEAARKLKGYQPDEIIGNHCSIFYTAEDVVARKPEQALQMAAVEGRYEHEGWRVRKDGSRFWADVLLAAVFKDGELDGFWYIVRDDSRHKALEESVRQVSERLLEARYDERRRLGRELHDSTAQTLGALAINLAVLKEYLRSSASPEVCQVMTDLTELTQQAAREIRTVSYLLHPPVLEAYDLPTALAQFVEGFVEKTKVRVTLESEAGLDRLPADVELALFRVAQESLTNVYRHSGSPTARVRLVQTSEGITLEVSDDGRGLPSNTPSRHQGLPSTSGLGLCGMRERMQQLGGSFEVDSQKTGLTVRAVVPLGSLANEPAVPLDSQHEGLNLPASELAATA